MKFGFIYLWFDRKRKMFYVGSHCGPENDNYICGSNRMLRAYKKRPHDFKRRVIIRAKVDHHIDLKAIEQRYLDLIKLEEFGSKYYNFSKRAYGADPDRASAWMMGNKNNLGKKLSESTRKKISDFHKGRPQPEWLKKKSGLAKRGRKWYNNGVEESLCKICPYGWVKGRAKSYIQKAQARKYDASHGQKVSVAKLLSNARKRDEFGYVHTLETRQKISATKRRQFSVGVIS